jgi:hypothetical protein
MQKKNKSWQPEATAYCHAHIWKDDSKAKRPGATKTRLHLTNVRLTQMNQIHYGSRIQAAVVSCDVAPNK